MQSQRRSETCVYCSNRVPSDLFSYHIQSCRTGNGRLAVCPYNPIHRYPVGNQEWLHIRSCPSANMVMKVLNEMNSYAIVSAQLQKQLGGLQKDAVQRDKRSSFEINEESHSPKTQKKRKFDEEESQDEEM